MRCAIHTYSIHEYFTVSLHYLKISLEYHIHVCAHQDSKAMLNPAVLGDREDDRAHCIEIISL